jgi:uncharacterized protein (TIGR03435 family)
MAQETPPPAAAADARPALEVATIKPSLPNEPRFFQVDGLKLRTSATTVADLMTFAYSIHAAQIVGGPEWMRADRYDVVMQPDLPSRPSTAQMRVIMQQLLADRFELVMHHATKELQVYAIVPAKRGAHLATVQPDEAAGNTAAGMYAPGRMLAKNASVAEFANLMNRYMQLQWPVVDDTHLAGKFDFEVSWTPAEGERAAIVNGATPPELFAAMDEQLGLELKPTKEQVDVLVIDGVGRPEAN